MVCHILLKSLTTVSIQVGNYTNQTDHNATYIILLNTVVVVASISFEFANITVC
jgi:hypothetical protein